MDRNNYGYKQVVQEAELDGSFDNCEVAEHNLALEAGISQAKTSDFDPDARIFGGISNGLVVSRNGSNDYVTVTAGEARDDDGLRIGLPIQATVKITYTGDTDEGDTTDAVGDGAAITGSCGDGQRIIASLFIVYDEHESDTRTDGLDVEYNFQIDESFHFNIEVGTAFTHPPGATPSRAPLENGKVLLADLLLERSGSDLYVVDGGVCCTTADWYAFTGYYNNLDGRRSDVLSLDDSADFPLWRVEGMGDFGIRGGSARAALRLFAMQLAKTTFSVGDPDGSAIIGQASMAGTEALTPFYPLDLEAGPVKTAISYLLQEINKKLNKGPDDHRAFFDDFMYKATAAASAWDPDTTDRWAKIGSGTFTLSTTYHGGVVAIASSSALAMQTGYDPSYNNMYWWLLATDHGGVFRVKIMMAAWTNVTAIHIGFIDSAGTTEAGLNIDNTGKVKARVTDPVGGEQLSASEVTTMGSGNWYTFDVTAQNNGVVLVDADSGDSVSVSCGGAGTFGTNRYAFHFKVTASGGTATLEVDTVSISDLNPR